MSTIILGLGGSLRLGSTTTLALQSALAGAQEAGAHTRLIDLATLRLPLFNGTYTLDGYTSAERKEIMTLLEAADEAQGFILASPTYHNTISRSLKNALDITETLHDDRPSRLAGSGGGSQTAGGGALV